MAKGNSSRFFTLGSLQAHSLAWAAWACLAATAAAAQVQPPQQAPVKPQTPTAGNSRVTGNTSSSSTTASSSKGIEDPSVVPPTSQNPGNTSAAGKTAGDGSTPDKNQVNVSSYSTVDIHVQNTDLAKVLQMLSIQSQRNIIVSKNVSGTVSADLYDVTFFEALDAILNANGYGYIQEGNFIKVYTLDEIRQIKDAQRQLTYKTFKLSYLNASDASVFVTPLLSDKGTIARTDEVKPGIVASENDVGADSWADSATIVVHDYPENIEQIGKLIDELDTRPQQVLVEATVLQTALTEDNAWGVDWSIVAGLNFTDVANPLGPVTSLLTGSGTGGTQLQDNNGTALQSSIGQTSSAGGLKLGVISNDVSVFLRVLDETTDTTVISRPKVLALNRNRGSILVGRKIGYLSTTSTDTTTTQTVQFLDTGTQLKFRPFIGKDGFIRMELMPSVSEGIIRDVTGGDGNTFTIPDEITQELVTNVVVHDGYTIVLGGLFKEETDLHRRQIPVLGDIPILGAAFKGKDDSTTRSEITFLITPTIMKDEDLVAQGKNAADSVDKARIAARQGVLFWSNDRLTSQHNMQAEELLAKGDKEMALWHIDQSLFLKPDQPLVLEMREHILGTSDSWFNGSLMGNMIRERVDQLMKQNHEQSSAPTDGNSGEKSAANDASAQGTDQAAADSSSAIDPLMMSSPYWDAQPAPASDSDAMEPVSTYGGENGTMPELPEEEQEPAGNRTQTNADPAADSRSEPHPREVAGASSRNPSDSPSSSSSVKPGASTAVGSEVGAAGQKSDAAKTAPNRSADAAAAATGAQANAAGAATAAGPSMPVFSPLAKFQADMANALVTFRSLTPIGGIDFSSIWNEYYDWVKATSENCGIATVPTDSVEGDVPVK